SLKTGMINVKVLMEFRNASERARQASAAVQEWLEALGKGNDPYKLMSQVMSQRVEMATQLLKDIAHDMESGDVDFDTPGLRGFGTTVQNLAELMSRLFPRCLYETEKTGKFFPPSPRHRKMGTRPSGEG